LLFLDGRLPLVSAKVIVFVYRYTDP
jgi:hypothetical protein